MLYQIVYTQYLIPIGKDAFIHVTETIQPGTSGHRVLPFSQFGVDERGVAKSGHMATELLRQTRRMRSAGKLPLVQYPML